MLETALKIALEAHAGQVDKSGRPYILHPLQLMSEMETDSEKVVALLHDVIEDSDMTLQGLIDAGIPRHIAQSVENLSRQSGEDYHDFTERVSWDKLSTKVKLADLRHNMDITRLEHPLSDKDIERLKKYRRAYNYLYSPPPV